MVDENMQQARLAFAIEAAMAAQDLDDKGLGRLIGKSPKTVERYRRGLTAPSALELPRLAAALGVTPAFLADPPEIPTYPLAQYLVDEEAVERVLREGLALGVRRSSGRVASLAERSEPARQRPRSLHEDGQG
jgi:transcriptional regulator with XRE-family HTH domain